MAAVAEATGQKLQDRMQALGLHHEDSQSDVTVKDLL